MTYVEVETTERSKIVSLLAEFADSEDAVQITLNKRGETYRATLVQAIEPPPTV